MSGETNVKKTSYLDERIEDAQIWANYLDKVRKGAEIIPIRKKL